MAAPFPTQIALIFCRVLFIGEPDANAGFTGWRNTEWDLSQGVMHCRREVVEVYDPSVDQGGAPQPFNPAACMRTAMRLGPQFDVDNRDRPWRFWRAACPTPIMSDNNTPDNPRTITSWIGLSHRAPTRTGQWCVTTAAKSDGPSSPRPGTSATNC